MVEMTIASTDGTSDEDLLEQDLNELEREIRSEGFDVRAELTKTSDAHGARRGAGEALSTLVIHGAATSAVLGSLVTIATQWLRNRRSREVIFRDRGDELRMKGLGEKEQSELARAWLQRRSNQEKAGYEAGVDNCD